MNMGIRSYSGGGRNVWRWWDLLNAARTEYRTLINFERECYGACDAGNELVLCTVYERSEPLACTNRFRTTEKDSQVVVANKKRLVGRVELLRQRSVTAVCEKHKLKNVGRKEVRIDDFQY